MSPDVAFAFHSLSACFPEYGSKFSCDSHFRHVRIIFLGTTNFAPPEIAIRIFPHFGHTMFFDISIVICSPSPDIFLYFLRSYTENTPVGGMLPRSNKTALFFSLGHIFCMFYVLVLVFSCP